MRILILSHTRRISNFKIGSHHYANGLSNDCEVEYLGFPYTLLHKLSGKSTDGVEQLKKNVLDFKSFFLFPITLKNNKFIIAINRFFLKLSLHNNEKKYDVIICDSPYFSPYVNVIPHSSLIYRPTDIYELMDGDKINYYEKDILTKCDGVIATSEVVMHYLKTNYEMLIKDKKILEVLSNGYDDSIFNNENTLDNRRDAIYIGALDKRFDFDALDYLANEYPDDKFDIYGPIAQEYQQQVQLISKNRSNVTFFGAVDYQHTPSLLKKHCIGLLLLKNNDLNRGRSPMKLWEYISCGLVVVYGAVDVEEKYKKSGPLFKYNDNEDLIQKYNLAKESNGTNYQIDLQEHSWSYKVNKLKMLLSTE
ncbi:glycosyltransferase [Klebsiella aerogenes]|uniref:glycosyltransferase n=1 Tax=Klebsiella aerogenes TaxID=548 RepID=UPI00397931A9